MVYQVAKTVAEKMREDKYKAHDNKTDHLKAYTATRQTMDDTWQGKEARCVETEQAVRDQERVVRGLRKIKEDALEMKNKLGAQSGESPPLKPLAPSSLKQRDEAADQRKVEKKQTLNKKERKEYQIPKKPSVKEAELMKRVAEIVASSPGLDTRSVTAQVMADMGIEQEDSEENSVEVKEEEVEQRPTRRIIGGSGTLEVNSEDTRTIFGASSPGSVSSSQSFSSSRSRGGRGGGRGGGGRGGRGRGRFSPRGKGRGQGHFQKGGYRERNEGWMGQGGMDGGMGGGLGGGFGGGGSGEYPVQGYQGGYQGGPPQGMMYPQGPFHTPQGQPPPHWQNGRYVDSYGYEYGIPMYAAKPANHRYMEAREINSGREQPPMVEATKLPPVVTFTRVESPRAVDAPVTAAVTPAVIDAPQTVQQSVTEPSSVPNSAVELENSTEAKEESSDDERLSKEQVTAIRQKYATYSTANLMRLPLLAGQRMSVAETVSLSSTLVKNVEELRLGAGDNSKSSDWVRGWDIALEKHVLNSVSSRLPNAQGLDLKAKITSSFSQTRQQLDNGMAGREALNFLVRVLTRTLSMATPQHVVFALQNLEVDAGTPFSEYMNTLRALVQNAMSVGHESAQDNVLQLAVRDSVCDQYSNIAVDVFKGRDLMAVPYDSIRDLMDALEVLAWNTTEATAVKRNVISVQTKRAGQGGGNASAGTTSYASAASAGRMYGKQPSQGARVMNIHEEMEDEEKEFKKVHYVATQWEKGKGDESYIPFYTRFDSRKEQDEARQAYGLKCLNCGDQSHFVRECTHPFINKSNMLNPELGQGPPQLVKERWSKWLKRLRDWHEQRRCLKNTGGDKQLEDMRHGDASRIPVETNSWRTCAT
ncbi:unnamed protein product [Ectocarpus sp. CCAP 1310/34]|nr:unnamed protein product [Ectocarpus sp. CCAP 1310/34]